MNPKFKKFLNGLVLACSVIILVMFAIYSMAWYTFTKRAEMYLDMVWQDKANFTITGERPNITGYPYVPKATFSGTIEHQSDFKVVTPEITFAGFPAPQQTQVLEAPKGIQISSTFLDRDLNFDYAYLQFVPPQLPASNKYDDIQAWQKSERIFNIHQIVLKAGKIYARGEGTLSLDANLQLSANINARVVGMDILFDDMAKQQGEKTIAVARSFFNMMSQTDPTTGEKFFETTLKIQDRGIYFGPMLVSRLPEIRWRDAPPPVVPARQPLNPQTP